jgi:hypothetical protein
MTDLTHKMFVVKSGKPRLNKAEERFFLFIKKVKYPITEQKIIDYYKEYVSRENGRYYESHFKDGVYYPDKIFDKFKEYDEYTWHTYALNWFDKYLGRFVRLNYLMQLNILHTHDTP